MLTQEKITVAALINQTTDFRKMLNLFTVICNFFLESLGNATVIEGVIADLQNEYLCICNLYLYRISFQLSAQIKTQR